MVVTRDTSQRRLQISELVRQHGSVQVAALAQRFGVSMQTVRKDLRYLTERGVMARAYGGAIDSGVVGGTLSEPPYEAKRTVFLEEKRRIGQRAAALVKANPELKWCDTSRRGYMALTLTPDSATNEWIMLDTIKAHSTKASIGHTARVSRGRNVMA
jgi:DeoR/GlpR family transcriptional regulator of sugar metabolism